MMFHFQKSGLLAAVLGVGLSAVQPAVSQESAEEPSAEAPAVGTDDAAAIDESQDETESQDKAARRTHLNVLFERLADPEAEDWRRVQAQIVAAWNRSGSPSMDLLARRADEAVEAKDYDKALLFLNDLVRLAPDFAEGWNKRATVHFLRDDYGRSLEDIARTLALEPRHFGAWSGLGVILDRLEDKESALEAYRRAIEIHPHLPGAAEGIRKLTSEVEGERL